MSAEPPQLPTIVTDRYTIEKEIGAGGMATVYLARDSRHDREVALKVLRPELGVVLGADRFLSEIKITARLDHPHILTLTTFAEGAQGGWLSDGSFLAHLWETPDAVTLTKLKFPGGAERLMTIPHVARDFSHSSDLTRATLGWRDSKADAFMYRVVKQ